MTRFTDGPAQGKNLLLARSPLFLRVVLAAGDRVDALDQLDDAPAAQERIVLYRRASRDGTCHVDGRDARGRRVGRWYSCATYVLHDVQPEEAVLRDTVAWRAWATAEQARLKEQASG